MTLDLEKLNALRAKYGEAHGGSFTIPPFAPCRGLSRWPARGYPPVAAARKGQRVAAYVIGVRGALVPMDVVSRLNAHFSE